MKFVYWYCPKCGRVYNCFTSQKNNHICFCSELLKETDIDCAEGIIDSVQYHKDMNRIINRYLENCIAPEKLSTMKELYPVEIKFPGLMIYSLEYTSIKRKYFEPKIQEWRTLMEQDVDPKVDYAKEYDNVQKLLKQYENDVNQAINQKEERSKLITYTLVGIGVIILIIMLFKECASVGSSSETCSCGKRYNTTYGMCSDCYEDFKYAKDAYEGIIND